MDCRQIEMIAHARFPSATEIHVQFHIHHVQNYVDDSAAGSAAACLCAVQGHDLNKQFSAASPEELAKKIKEDQADWKDYKRFVNPAVSQY